MSLFYFVIKPGANRAPEFVFLYKFVFFDRLQLVKEKKLSTYFAGELALLTLVPLHLVRKKKFG